MAGAAAAAALAAGWQLAQFSVSARAERAPAPSPAPSRVTRVRPPAPAPAPAARAPAPVPAPPRLRVTENNLCSVHARGDAPHFLARADLTRTADRDPDDLLTLVDRSALFSLPPDYAPQDLVDVFTMAPDARCARSGNCLRLEAAQHLRGLLHAMDEAGVPGHIASGFRPYGVQCDTFQLWAYERGRGFCDATEQSALAGHSQHQLGTAVDLFTRAWAHEGPVFRNDFACSRGGRFLEAHAWEHGFVVAYPQHPDYRHPRRACKPRDDVHTTVDPRTGYRYEPWHLRYLGVENAASYHAAYEASGPGTAGEITLEQWLRARLGLAGDAVLPVCDGCSCGACTTLAADGESPTPCGERALQLRDDGSPVVSADAPELLAVRVVARQAGVVVVEADVRVPAHTVTQPPLFRAGPAVPLYAAGESYRALTWIPGAAARGYEDLPGAWRLAAEVVGDAGEAGEAGGWRYRASLGDEDVPLYWNGTNLYLPAAPGARTVRMALVPPVGARALRVGLWREGSAYGVVEVAVAAGSGGGSQVARPAARSPSPAYTALHVPPG